MSLYKIDLSAIPDPFWSGPHANVEYIIDDLIRGGALKPFTIPDPQAQSAGDLVVQANMLNEVPLYGRSVSLEQTVRDIVESWLGEWVGEETP